VNEAKELANNKLLFIKKKLWKEADGNAWEQLAIVWISFLREVALFLGIWKNQNDDDEQSNNRLHLFKHD